MYIHFLEIATLKGIHVCIYQQQYIASTAGERKKLSVQVLSTAAGGAGDPEVSVRHTTQPDDGLSRPPSLREVQYYGTI